jgi:predicted metalloenzyme YecM
VERLVNLVSLTDMAKLHRKLILDLSQGSILHFKLRLHHQSPAKGTKKKMNPKKSNSGNYELACGCHELLYCFVSVYVR